MTAFGKAALAVVMIQQDRETARPFDKALARALVDTNNNLDSILNGGITFEDNMDCKVIDYTSNGVADTEDTVAHGLGKVPTGYIVASVDKAGIVYKSGTAHTSTNLFLKCSAATTAVKLIVF